MTLREYFRFSKANGGGRGIVPRHDWATLDYNHFQRQFLTVCSSLWVEFLGQWTEFRLGTGTANEIYRNTKGDSRKSFVIFHLLVLSNHIAISNSRSLILLLLTLYFTVNCNTTFKWKSSHDKLMMHHAIFKFFLNYQTII